MGWRGGATSGLLAVGAGLQAGQGAPPQAGWPPGWLAAGWAGQGAPPNHKQNFLSLNLKTLDLNLKTLDLNLKTLTNVLRHLRIFLRHLS